MGVSGLKAALIAQSIAHLGANVEVPRLNVLDLGDNPDPYYTTVLDHLEQSGDTDTLKTLEGMLIEEGIAERIPNPENTYDEEYGGKWFHSQYGDGGYCADFFIYGLAKVYEATGNQPDIPMKTGLGQGTANFASLAGDYSALVELDNYDAFTAGNIMAMSHTLDPSETDGYNGHMAMILSSEAYPGLDGVLKIRVLEANAPFEYMQEMSVVVSNFFYDEKSKELIIADSNWELIDGAPSLILNSVIDPDLLPNAEAVSLELSDISYSAELPDGGYLNEGFTKFMQDRARAALAGRDLVAPSGVEKPSDFTEITTPALDVPLLAPER